MYTGARMTAAVHLQILPRRGATLFPSLLASHRQGDVTRDVPRTAGEPVPDRRAMCGRGKEMFLINVIGDHC